MTSDEGVRVHISAELAILTRASILGHIAREIASVFEHNDKVLDKIMRGVREKWLEIIELILYAEPGKVVGYLAIHIDWNEYSMQLEAGGPNKFKIDPTRPVTRQLSPLLAKAAAYIAERRKTLNVQTTEVVWTYRAGTAEKARKALGTSPISAQTRKNLDAARQGRQIKISDASFSELFVEFRYRNPESRPGQGP